MKKLFTLLLMASALALNAQQSITLASDIWPPFTNVAGQKAIATSLVRQALNRSGIKSIHKIIDPHQILMGIDKKLYDGSAALWYNDKKSESLFFSIPYLQNRLILVGKKGADVSATKISDLKGKKIGLVDAYHYGIESDTSIHFIQGKSDQANLQLLLEGKEDYILVDALLVQYLLTYQGIEAREYLEVGSTPLLNHSLHFVIRKDVPNAEHIIERFNKEITKMVLDGTYNQILALNWIRMDIDGDGRAMLVLNGTHAGTRPPTTPYSIMTNSKIQKNPAFNSNSRFYIEGHTYDGWDSVPNQYKTPPTLPNSNDIIKLKFRIQD